MMNKVSPIIILVMAVAIGGFAGCSGESSSLEWGTFQAINHTTTTVPASDPQSEVQTLAIRPAYTKIVGLGETVQLTADVWFTDGSLCPAAKDSILPPSLAQDQPAPDPIPLVWKTENYGIADVDSSGLVTAVSSGDTFIHVRVNGHEALARIIVENKTSLDPNIDETGSPPAP